MTKAIRSVTQGGTFTKSPTLLLQWHVTERCNLRCKHCYQLNYEDAAELTWQEQLTVIDQFKELLKMRELQTHTHWYGHITVTGGEPFLRNDFMELLQEFSRNRNHFSFAILTNGTLIDEHTARMLTDLHPYFVQLSVEGLQSTHDRIRGHGSFDQVVQTSKILKQAGIRTLLSFTAHRANFREYEEVARLGAELEVDKVWSDRLIPCGNGARMDDSILSPDETRRYLDCLRRARQMYGQGQTKIGMDRALQFLACGGEPYHCSAGRTLLTLMPNGDVYPCRRMPIVIGNIHDQTLTEIYSESELLHRLRDRDQISKGCERCYYRRTCGGGLKCLAYAVYGDPFIADPGCWYAAQR